MAQTSAVAAKVTTSTMNKWMGEYKPEITKLLMPALGDAGRIDRWIQSFIATSTATLAACDPRSIMACMFQLAQLGLEPGQAHAHAYLIPRWDKDAGTSVCTLQISAKGFVYMAQRVGIRTHASIIYDSDTWELSYGKEVTFWHKIGSGPRTTPIGAYCQIWLPNGDYHVEYVSVEAINAARRQSDNDRKAKEKGNKSTWDTFWHEMAIKYVTKRGLKYMPTSFAAQGFDLVRQAVTFDDLGNARGNVSVHVAADLAGKGVDISHHQDPDLPQPAYEAKFEPDAQPGDNAQVEYVISLMQEENITVAELEKMPFDFPEVAAIPEFQAAHKEALEAAHKRNAA